MLANVSSTPGSRWGFAKRAAAPLSDSERIDAVRECRGLGALQAIEFNGSGTGARVSDRVLQHGIIVLAEGPRAEVLALTPPVTITDQQLETALNRIEQVMAEL